MNSRWRAWLAVGVAWTALATLAAGQNVAYRTYSGQEVPWLRLLSFYLVDWYSLALFTPALLWLARRFPLSRERWAGPLGIQLVASLAMAVAKVFISVPLFGLVWPENHYTVSRTLAGAFFPQLGALWAAMGIAHAIQYYRALQLRELRTAQLQAELSRAQLEQLKGQLQPHFLFNTLHAISTLMHRDVEAANNMLAELGNLLRLALIATADAEVPLKQELDLVRGYLRIMQIRFGERLVVRYAIADDTLDASVPSFILQPLVENALQHGVSKRSDPGTVALQSSRHGDVLELRISDSGSGAPDAALTFQTGGIGLSNTRARLEHLYGEQQRLQLVNRPEGGLEVNVSIPYRAFPNAEAHPNADR